MRRNRRKAVKTIVSLVAILVLSIAMALPAYAAIIDNGTVQLGINPEGHFNVEGGTESLPSDSTTAVGLRYIPTNGEATAPGCFCEGWGVANADAATGIFAGFANIATDGGAKGLVLLPETGVTDTADKTKEESEGSAFKSVVSAGGGRLKVTHHYKPSASPNLYEVEITVENTGKRPIGDLRYRRVMDWDIAPVTFSEFVEIHVGEASNVILATTDGFQSANPLSSPGPNIGTPPTTLHPGSPDYVARSASDQGSLFDFGFGELKAGEKKTFKTYYGAAENRKEALNALSAVGAEVYSFGIPSDPATGAPSLNGPHIFIFAFGEVGGDSVDTIAPTTTLVASSAKPAQANGWFSSDITVTLNAVDKLPGSKVDKTYYRIDGGAWKEYSAPFQFSSDKNYKVDYYSKDLAGNIELEKSTTLKLDKTSPVTRYGLQKIEAVNKKGTTYIAGFKVTLKPEDQLSGVSHTFYRINGGGWTAYTDPFEISANNTRTLEYYTVDNAGNVEISNVMDFVNGTFTGAK
ncbi:OmpL47-type beta-barrel domain-containing protein [Cohnella faecalis]|nr:hypothetical protein [Cohnella faecalis]